MVRLTRLGEITLNSIISVNPSNIEAPPPISTVALKVYEVPSVIITDLRKLTLLKLGNLTFADQLNIAGRNYIDFGSRLGKTQTPLSKSTPPPS